MHTKYSGSVTNGLKNEGSMVQTFRNINGHTALVNTDIC